MQDCLYRMNLPDYVLEIFKMRRRDSDCMLVANNKDTDKPKFEDVYNKDFKPVKKETFEWLKQQEIIDLFYNNASDEKYMELISMRY